MEIMNYNQMLENANAVKVLVNKMFLLSFLQNKMFHNASFCSSL